MAAREPLLEKLGEIPDPAASLADRPAPEMPPPQGRSTTRAARRTQAAAVVVVTLAWIAYVLWDRGLRGDLGAVATAGPIVAWVCASILALIFVFRRDARGLPSGVRVAQAVVVALPLLFLVTAGIADNGSDTRPFTWSTAAPCLLWSGIAGAVPAVAAALFLGRSFLSAPVWRGAAAGAICGLGATITIHAHCSATEIAHVLVAHGLAVVGGALLGALLGALGGRA